MGGDLALRTNATALRHADDLDVLTLGKVMAASGFFKDSTGQAQAIVKILAGRELGFGPVASMTGVYIVEGKVTLSANLMAAAIKRSGRYTYRVRELNAKVCRLEFFECGQAIGVSEYTIDKAKAAGLAGKQTWLRYPENMLFARALSNGARWHTPDIFGGPVYTPEELGAEVDGETGEIVNHKAPPSRPLVVEDRAPAPAAPAEDASAEPPDIDGDFVMALSATARPAGDPDPDYEAQVDRYIAAWDDLKRLGRPLQEWERHPGYALSLERLTKRAQALENAAKEGQQ